jgi:hypothetical protein
MAYIKGLSLFFNNACIQTVSVVIIALFFFLIKLFCFLPSKNSICSLYSLILIH